MTQIVFRFGLIAGALMALMLALTIPLYRSGTLGFDNGEIIGYSSMVLAFLLVFFGIRAYREGIGDGAITFWKALQVGLLITLVASVVYVAAWQVIYRTVASDFMEKYTTWVIEKARAEGATEAAIEAKQAQMAKFAELYRNPLFNVAITFAEPLPAGLIMTLVSAGILRRRPSPPRDPAVVAG